MMLCRNIENSVNALRNGVIAVAVAAFKLVPISSLNTFSQIIAVRVLFFFGRFHFRSHEDTF